MRTVSFVDHLEFEYQGNISSKAIAVGDVDNDQNNELVLGNVDGELFIFKDRDSKPWNRCLDLGMITCLEIGDVCNHGMNFVVTLSLEGWCHVLVVSPEAVQRQDSALSSGSSEGRVLKPTHRQQLAPNNKVLLISDIDGDGLCELVIGSSDRRVRMYRWKELADTVANSPMTLNGKFVLVETWQLAGQIGSMKGNKKCDGSVELMVSQPGGTFVSLLVTNAKVMQEGEAGNMEEVTMTGPSLVYHPLGSVRARNPGVTTEVVGAISRQKKGDGTPVPNYSAICTLDGTLTLVDDDKILWSLYVDHQLFALGKLDVTGDGMEEVVACSWDGQTYLVNLNKEVVRFQFKENVAAFCAGNYSVGKNNVPCLIYASFSGRVMVYHNISMPQIGTSNLVQTMGQKDGIQDLLSYLNCDTSKPAEVRKLYQWILYGYKPRVEETQAEC